MSVSIEKLALMLDVYRGKLEKANVPPIDYVEGMRLSAKISILEDLFSYAHHENFLATQQPRPLSAIAAELAAMKLDEPADTNRRMALKHLRHAEKGTME